jgi:hypothetical protein
VAVREGFWNEVRQLAEAKKVRLAHSTPCFEFWLLLHFGFTTRGDLFNGSAAKSALKAMCGQDYSTNEKEAREAIASFVSKWPEAIVHSEKVRLHHAAARTRSPANPSTEMDRLVRALNDSAPPWRRRISLAGF